jgi:type VI secretion system protein ImpL
VKNTLLKILKFFLIGVAVVLVMLLMFALVFLMDWPWWVGLFLILGVVSLIIGALFLKKLLKRRNEQQFVQQVIEQDESRLKKLSQQERDELKELQDKWKAAVETLRRSHLKKQGNPLYVLPWYLVMGESGSGKTTAINSAQLSSPFLDVNRTSGISGTRSCDWWFFEQAIIIDTAGRYTIPIDEGSDKDEWQKFLTLLVKYRKKEPIHGLILAVSADKLLGATAEELAEDGRKVRRRMDELMRVLGIKFPVYLLVTKCDLIQGMSPFSEQLPEKALDQPMGFVNQDLSKDVTGFLDKVMAGIGERLRHLRLILLNQPGAGSSAVGHLLFPEEFDGLKKGLIPFVKTAFQENPYQDTPILRGLYFSSGRQEGTPYSHFLKGLGLIGEKELLPGTSKGLFLHDFFADILPKDRGLFAPTSRALEWQVITRNLGLASWILLGLTISGLLSYSFVKNLTIVRNASHVASGRPEFKGDFAIDSGSLDTFRRKIRDIESQNSHWWMPRFGLNESLKVEAKLKADYCKQFQQRFLLPYDSRMFNAITTFTPSTPDGVAGQYIVHLVRRINLLKTRLASSDFTALNAKPLPIYVMDTPLQGSDVETKKTFGNLYLDYLHWRSNTNDITQDISQLQTWLQRLLAIKGANLQWLVEWVNRDGAVSPVTLQSFWGGSLMLAEERQVAPAFTRKGKDMIDSLIIELSSALPESTFQEKDKTAFFNWYRSGSFSAWQDFASVFPKGAQKLRDAKERQHMASIMATDQGPYLALLNRMTTELEPLVTTDGVPPWLQQAYQFQLMRSRGETGALISKAAKEGQKAVGKIETLFGKGNSGSASLESASVAAKSVQDHMKALAAIAPATQTRNQSYQMALQVFSEDPISSKSPFFGAYNAVESYRRSIPDGKVDGIFWNIFTGPITYLWGFALDETACSLQAQWEEKVLQEAQGVVDQQATQYLLMPDGPVWKFAKGPAAPFLGWSPQKGYFSRVALGGAVPFDPVFYSFLKSGANVKAAAVQKQNFGVSIRGLPTDSNPDARIKPQSTRLEMQCAGGNQALENLNFPITKTFNWSPDSCGDVVLQIDVGDTVLTKRYTGPQAFPDFLSDFKGGRHTFTPADFRSEKQALDRMGVKYIRVNYLVSGGGQAVVGQAKSMPGQAPRSIARCLD